MAFDGFKDAMSEAQSVKVVQEASARLDAIRAGERQRLAAMVEAATPPEAMAAAAAAPARGAMRLERDFDTVPGGSRKSNGVHWRDLCRLEAMNQQARQRHEARQPVDAEGNPRAFVPPFTSGQIAIARAYRDLVEWREGSGLRCASVEVASVASAGGAGGTFADVFLDKGRYLDYLLRRIGTGVIMDIRRHMDRGNARRPISARAAIDAVALGGADLSSVLTSHGWSAKGAHRNALRTALCAVLDRMQGLENHDISAWRADDWQPWADRPSQKGD